MEADELVTDREGLRAIIQSLIVGWEADRGDSLDLGQRDQKPDSGRFVVIHSLAAHAHRMACACLALDEHGMTLEVIPLVRACYESALTAVWLAQNKDGGRAFANEFARQQGALQMSLAKSENPVFNSGVALPHVDWEKLETASQDQARNFIRMCEDFEGGSDLYLYYRLMSGLSHPSMKVADQYVQPAVAGDDVEALLRVPRTEPDAFWMFFLAASVVWAGTAVDYIEISRARRAELRQAAKAIGVERDLKLTFAAMTR